MGVVMADDGRGRGLISRLLNGTIMGARKECPPVPDNVIDAMRHLAEEPEAEQPGDTPYAYAKRRFNRIWAGRDSYPDNDPGPVEKFKTLRGALTAYWTGEKWAQAWAGTAATLGIATLNAQNVVWVSQAGAAFTNAIAEYLMKPAAGGSMQPIIDNAQTLGAFGALFIGGMAVQDYLKFELQRRMAGWMTGKFNEAVLSRSDTIYRITHNRSEDSKSADAMPEGPHQRMSGAISAGARQFTNFSVGAWGAVMTSAFVGKALWDSSVPVGFLDKFGQFLNERFPNSVIDFMPGEAGTFALAMTTVAAYSAVTFPLALSFGKALERTGSAIQKTASAHTESLVNMFNRGQAMAESNGHRAQKRNLDHVYDSVDKAWHADNGAMAKYSAYSFLTGFMGYHFVSLGPGLAGSLSRSLDFKGFMESQLYVGAALQSIGFFTNMIPTIKSMKVSFERVAGMATIIDRVRDGQAFYRLSGRNDFTFSVSEDADVALRVKDMALYHRGIDKPFVALGDVTINKGDYVYMEGESGCGKSSVFRAISGLYPYGAGAVEAAANTSLFFARQKADVNAYLTLGEQVVYGAESNVLDFEPDAERIKWALQTVGLGQFADSVDVLNHEGKPWPEVLSGGQEQRLVLARILYQQPDLLLLDEATSALNPVARREFFQILRANCPDTTVMAIMHTDTPGEFPHNKRLRFADGQAVIEDASTYPASRTEIKMPSKISKDM